MKIIVLLLLVIFSSCGQESSPEGRMNIRVDKLETRLDSLINQNHALKDSLAIVNDNLRKIQLNSGH